MFNTLVLISFAKNSFGHSTVKMIIIQQQWQWLLCLLENMEECTHDTHDSGVQQAASTTQPQSGKHAV